MKRAAFPLLGIIFTTLVFLPIVRAEDVPQQGVRMTIYNGFPSPDYQPWVAPFTTEPCFDAIVTHINFDWGGGPAAEGCDADFFAVHYSGWITVPESGAYEFLALVDDGWRMTINDQLINDNWTLKGCGGWWSGPNEGFIELTAGMSYPLDAWMYEWGGGACAILWYGSPTNYGVVPADWLTTSALPAPTPEPSPEQSQEPSVAPTPEPSPSESPSVEPTPSVVPSASEVPSVEPSPLPEPSPSSEPSPTPKPSPVPSPSESVSPSPSPLPSPSPEPVNSPSVEPEPSPSASPDNIGEQAAAAVGEAVTAVAETVSKAVEAIANLGKDLSPAEKKKAAPVAVAIVISQVASAAVAAASSAAAASAARKVDK